MTTRTMERPLRHPMHEAESKAERGTGWYSVLARTGLVAKGISFAIVGVLALKLALGDGGKATSRNGALQQLAGTTFGTVLLIALAFGFAAYAIWRFVQAIAEKPNQEDSAAKAWAKRAAYVGRGLIYAALTYSTVHILLGGHEQSQNGKAHKTAGMVFSWPAGRWLVGIAGLVIVGVGLWNLYRGLSKKFEDRWTRGYSKWGSRAGVLGHIARFVVFGLIGVFAVKAAINYNPKDAIGLDGALQKLAHSSYGPYLLGLTAAGLIAYAIYCFVDARYRDVTP
jgi:Domain of Unknown Function (DUF1206)